MCMIHFGHWIVNVDSYVIALSMLQYQSRLEIHQSYRVVLETIIVYGWRRLDVLVSVSSNYANYIFNKCEDSSWIVVLKLSTLLRRQMIRDMINSLSHWQHILLLFKCLSLSFSFLTLRMFFVIPCSFFVRKELFQIYSVNQALMGCVFYFTASSSFYTHHFNLKYRNWKCFVSNTSAISHYKL